MTLPSAGKLEIVFGGDYQTSGAWYIELYTASNEQVYSGRHDASNTVKKSVCTTGLPAGAYYVKVSGQSSVTGLSYNFTPKFTASTAWETS